MIAREFLGFQTSCTSYYALWLGLVGLEGKIHERIRETRKRLHMKPKLRKYETFHLPVPVKPNQPHRRQIYGVPCALRLRHELHRALVRGIPDVIPAKSAAFPYLSQSD